MILHLMEFLAPAWLVSRTASQVTIELRTDSLEFQQFGESGKKGARQGRLLALLQHTLNTELKATKYLRQKPTPLASATRSSYSSLWSDLV